MTTRTPVTFALRHGIPAHDRYKDDPGIAHTEENEGLTNTAGLEIASYFDVDPHVAIAASPSRRALETGEALRQHPAISPFMVHNYTDVAHGLSEGAFSSESEYDRSWRLMALEWELARTAFGDMDDGNPCLILVTHDSVIKQLATLHNKEPVTDHLAVNLL